jgi:hypothetical protein
MAMRDHMFEHGGVVCRALNADSLLFCPPTRDDRRARSTGWSTRWQPLRADAGSIGTSRIARGVLT